METEITLTGQFTKISPTHYVFCHSCLRLPFIDFTGTFFEADEKRFLKTKILKVTLLEDNTISPNVEFINE